LAWSGLLYAAGGLLVLAGLALVALSALQFRRARTHIEPWKPTSAIVSDGVFAYSRNPIYLGFCLVTIGLGCVFRNPWMILSCLPSAWVVFQIAIRREEAYLSAKFPQEYGTYRARVRRWL
jgi:protein-S-isoprenylcysteine O-methyltransferase Ste14